jgi:hypothetical protein
VIDVETALHRLRVGLVFSEVSGSAVFGPKLVLSPYCNCTQQLRFPLATSRLAEPLITLLMADSDRLINDHTSVHYLVLEPNPPPSYAVIFTFAIYYV